MENVMKSGTTTIAILCKDGIVLAADRRATAGGMVVDRYAKKIYNITDYIAITTSGIVSDIQLLIKLLKAELRLKSFRTEQKPSVREAANLMAGMIYSNIRKLSLIPGLSHFLLGGIDERGYQAYDLFMDGSITRCRDFVVSGSGSVFALGVLEASYNKDITVKGGIELALKAMSSALKRDIASGEGVDVVTITEKGIDRVVKKKLRVEL